jgi:hypothetical protein
MIDNINDILMRITDIQKLKPVKGLPPDFTMLFIKAILIDKDGKESCEVEINCSRLKKEQQYLLEKGFKYLVDIAIEKDEDEKEIFLINIHAE